MKQIKILSKDLPTPILHAIKFMNQHRKGEYSVGGSVGLKLHGLITREPVDLDIITMQSYYGNPAGLINFDNYSDVAISHKGNSEKVFLEGRWITSFKMQFDPNHAVIDVLFYEKSQPTTFVEVVPDFSVEDEFTGMTFLLDDPINAVKAKQHYVTHDIVLDTKHHKDLDEINEAAKHLFPDVESACKWMKEDAYVLTSGYVGNCLLFYREGHAGYTIDINKAQVFTKAELKTTYNFGTKYDIYKAKDLYNYKVSCISDDFTKTPVTF